MNIATSLQSYGLNWRVEKRPLVCGETNTETGSYGLFRSDTGDWLSTVGRSYVPYQNDEMISNMSKAANELGYEISSAGSFQGGRKVFAQIQLPEAWIGGSSTKRLITLLNSHDGSYQVGVGMQNIVVVCQNRFNRIFPSLTKVRHTKEASLKVDNIVDKIQIGLRQEAITASIMLDMACTSAPKSINHDVIDLLFPVVDVDSGQPEYKARANKRRDNNIADLLDCISVDRNIHGDNLWGVFNGVTRFYTHNQKGLAYEMIGGGYKATNKAFDFLESKIF